jgi:hypothetical protein
VNGFHVHAIGWVLTANMFALTAVEAQELSDLWAALVRSRAEDLRQVSPLLRFLFPRNLPLVPATRMALATLVTRMAAQHPERFSADALRQRRNHWARQVALGLLLSGLAAFLMPTSWPRAALVAPTFFLMAFACVLPTIMLWRAGKAVQDCSTQGRAAWHLPRHLSHRSPTR